MKNALPYRREAYRLWFEYLRVARNSSLTRVREALKQSAPFYAAMGRHLGSQVRSLVETEGKSIRG